MSGASDPNPVPARDPHAEPAQPPDSNALFAADQNLRSPADASTVPGHPRARELPGTRIGPYKLLEFIGAGTFGEVWLAERREPYAQRVALKLIKRGMDSADVIARFEQERQALALMDHPNVARVLDGGVTSPELGSRPYFVMEYVAGLPFTHYCDRERLNIRQRLELFISVCDAVQHAHQKGILHRDLKPGNVLVASGDAAHPHPTPKVIDFGMAKALSGKLSRGTIHTEAGIPIGTLEYMSPELTGLDPSTADTRSDVYSLGVMLYEVLTGSRPFTQAAFDEIVRIIREVDPPRPSRRLLDSAPTNPELASRLNADVPSLARELRNELEWIPLKALRKSRNERYGSAADLGRDIRRYLDGQPLEAGPESGSYRARKFIRRNRAQVMAAGAVSVALVAGVVATGLALNRALTAEQGLRSQLAETEKAQKAERERADQLERVSDFQSQMLSQIDTTMAGVDLMNDLRERFVAAMERAGVPETERTTRVNAFQQELVRVNATDTAAAMIDRTILRPAATAIDAQFKDDPTTDASLRQVLADLYRSIGLFDAAYPLQEGALATRRRVLGDEHPSTLTSINNMGFLLDSQGRFDQAEPYYREALERCRRVLGEEHPNTLAVIDNLGVLLQNQGKIDQAESYVREALELRRRVLGEDHPSTLTSINNMGFVLQAQDKLEQAEPYFRAALEKSRRLLGEEHPDTIASINNMGSLLAGRGEPIEADPYFRESLAKRRRVLGEEHPDTIASINNMGFLLESQDNFKEAEPYYREALDKFRRILGSEHPSTLMCANSLAALLQSQGRPGDAEPYCREVLTTRRRVLGENHPHTLDSINNIAFLLQAQDKLADAEPYYREAVEKSRRVLGAEHPDTLASIIDMSNLLRRLGRHQETIDLLDPVEGAVRKAFGGGRTRRLADLLTSRSRAHVSVGYNAATFTLAEADLLEAHRIYLAAKSRGLTHRDTLACVQGLVDLYTAWNTAEPGKGYDVKAAEWKANLDIPEAPALNASPGGQR